MSDQIGNLGEAVVLIRSDNAKLLEELKALRGEVTNAADRAGEGFHMAFAGWAKDTFEEGIELAKKFGEELIEVVSKGAQLNDLRDNFERLTAAIGVSGDAALEKLRSGTHGLVGEYTLLQQSNKLLGAGMKLTANDFETVGAAARALAKQTGKDTKEAFEIVSGALVTGRAKALQAAGAFVELKGATDELKKELSAEGEEMNSASTIAARRGAVMEALAGIVKNAGDQELNLKEKVEKGRVALEDWIDDLGAAIAKSPALNALFDGIAKGLQEAFGGNKEEMIQKIVHLVESLAIDAVTLGQVAVAVAEAIGRAFSLVDLVFDSLGAGIADAASALAKVDTLIDHYLDKLVTYGRLLLTVMSAANPHDETVQVLQRVLIATDKYLKLSKQASIDQVTWFEGAKQGFRDMADSALKGVKGQGEYFDSLHKIGDVLADTKAAMEEVAGTSVDSTEEMRKLGEQTDHTAGSTKKMSDQDKILAALQAGVSDEVRRTITSLDQQGLSVEDIAKKLHLYKEVISKVLDEEKKRQQLEHEMLEQSKRDWEDWVKQQEKAAAAHDKNLKAMDDMERLADQNARKRLMSAYGFQRSEIDQWIKDEKAKIDLSVDNWQEAFDAIEKAGEEKYKLLASDTLNLQEKLKSALAQLVADTTRNRLAAAQLEADKQVAIIISELARRRAAIQASHKIDQQEKDRQIAEAEAEANKQVGIVQHTLDLTDELIRKHAKSSAIGDLISSITSIGQVAGGSFGAIVTQATGLIPQLVKISQGAREIEDTFKDLKHSGVTAFAQIAAEATNVATIMILVGQQIWKAWSKQDAAAELMRQLKAAHTLALEFASDSSLSTGLELGIEASRSALEHLMPQGTAYERLLTRLAAESLHLGQIIDDLGGISAKSLESIEDRAGRLFDLIALGGATGAAAAGQLNDVLKRMGDYFTQNGGLWDDTFKTLVTRAKELGINIEGLNSLLAIQQSKLVSGAIGITTSIGKAADAYKGYGQAAKDAFEAGDQAKGMKALEDQRHAVIVNQEEFDRLSRIELRAYNALVASGVDPVQAITQVGGGIDNLTKSAEAFGLSGNAAFDELKRWRELTDANAPLLAQLGNLNDLMVASANLGSLTADGFQDLETQGVSAYNQLTAAGLTQQEAETAMKPLLESIIKLHKDKGLAIDEETQKLIDQATQDGVLGAQQASTQDVLREGLGEIITLLGGDLPKAWQEMADKAREAADKIAGKDGLGKVDDGLKHTKDKINDGSLEWDLWAKEAEQAADDAKKAAEKAADDTQKAWDDLDIKPIPVEFQYRTTGKRPDFSSDGGSETGGSETPDLSNPDSSNPGSEPPQLSEGGYANWGAGTLAVLHNREAVMPIDDLMSMMSHTSHDLDAQDLVEAMKDAGFDRPNINFAPKLEGALANEMYDFANKMWPVLIQVLQNNGTLNNSLGSTIGVQ